MLVLEGIGVCKDIAIGNLLIRNKNRKIKEYKISDADAEILRFEKAKENEIKNREKSCQEVTKSLGKEEASIFEIHKMMLQDLDFCNHIISAIKNEKINAESAIFQAACSFENMFSSMDDPYMRERAQDVRDISDCMIDFLEGSKFSKINDSKEDIILFAEDIVPSEISLFEKENIKGFITEKGSVCSHISILARAMKIPGVVGLCKTLNEEMNGAKIIVDGICGCIYINPDETTLLKFKNFKKEIENENKSLEILKGQESVTKDGKELKIFANVTNLKDIEKSIENDAEGIGLFRSEFLFLNREFAPNEEEQFEIYKKAAEIFKNKPVIIRTLDIGTDKKAEYLGFPKEENPAMGHRGIRVCFDKIDLFKTQLKAIIRASAFGDVSLMLPMITSVDEVLKAKEIIKEVKAELKKKKIKFTKDLKLGIMIETPAAVLISDKLAKEVDFFSIGTNDLTQYTLAVDRQNEKVNAIYNQKHEAILKMIEITAKNAHKNGIWVGVCGELASDESLAEFFLNTGIHEISVASPFILLLRKKIRSI